MSILTKLDEYKYWRDEKLAHAPTQLEACIVAINNPCKLSKIEQNKIRSLCQTGNFALFEIKPCADYDNAIISINTQLGLVDFDQHLYAKSQGLAHLTQTNNKHQVKFIPYTNKNLGWHTDGYYNPPEQRIRAFSLFCVCPASVGGENQWIDPQMVYLLLREKNPDLAQALIHPEAMCIPEHKVNGKIRRVASIGAIFFVDEISGALSMRYTQRKKHIEFLDSLEIKQAVEHLDNLLNSTTDYHFSYLMSAGQGLLCNNILHKRTSFSDNEDKPRLLLRGRYFNQIAL